MARRSISVKQRAWLASQLDDWRSCDIVSADQSSRILDLYETPTELAERGRSELLLVLTSLAAFLIGLAVLLLIGYNWHAMPAAVKLLIIFTVLIATHALGFYLRFVRGFRMLSEVVFFLGCLFFGAAIFLIAQIYNLSGHYPDTVWWWAIGVLPFALCLESVLLHALFAALLALWCGMEVFGFAELGMWFGSRWDDLPNGAYSLLLLAIPGFVWAYRRASLAAVWLYVLLITWWTVVQPFAWRLGDLSPIFIGAVAGLMLIIGGSHPHGSRFAEPYRQLGVLLMAGVLMVLSFYSASQEIFGRQSYHFANTDDWRPGPFLGRAGSWALLAATAIAALGVLYLASKLQADESSEPIPPHERMLRTARRQWLPVALTSLMLFLFVWWSMDGGALIPTILANIAMIALGFWLIVTGLHQDAGRTFAAGVVYVLLWAVMRYIDMFGDVGGMLGAAGIFLMCGLALFGVAWFWRHRKELQHV
jgi:uncharacterized membrane protein